MQLYNISIKFHKDFFAIIFSIWVFFLVIFRFDSKIICLSLGLYINYLYSYLNKNSLGVLTKIL